jgi:hypothetical protein
MVVDATLETYPMEIREISVTAIGTHCGHTPQGFLVEHFYTWQNAVLFVESTKFDIIKK